MVTMSLVLHHLLPEDKRRALSEVKRVLKPGGCLHVADWGAPHGPAMSAVFFFAQAIDGFDRTRDHRAGRLPSILAEAGFGAVDRYARLRTAFGSLELLRAVASR
jgi:ubiquinone/menaquinone biosynthesis C-methylase UbiE